MPTNHPVVFDFVFRPAVDAPADAATVLIELVGVDGARVDGWVPDEQVFVDGVFRPRVDPATGKWSEAMWPNAKIFPAGTTYEYTVRSDGETSRRAFIVPDDDDEHWVYDLFTDYPGSIDDTGLAVERAQRVAADVDLQDQIDNIEGGGGGGGTSNLFVQDTDPGMTGPGLWIETDGDSVVTFWVETGV